MKLITMQSSPVSCHFLPLRYKYSPQHPVLIHPQSSTLTVTLILTNQLLQVTPLECRLTECPKCHICLYHYAVCPCGLPTNILCACLIFPVPE